MLFNFLRRLFRPRAEQCCCPAGPPEPCCPCGGNVGRTIEIDIACNVGGPDECIVTTYAFDAGDSDGVCNFAIDFDEPACEGQGDITCNSVGGDGYLVISLQVTTGAGCVFDSTDPSTSTIIDSCDPLMIRMNNASGSVTITELP